MKNKQHTIMVVPRWFGVSEQSVRDLAYVYEYLVKDLRILFKKQYYSFDDVNQAMRGMSALEGICLRNLTLDKLNWNYINRHKPSVKDPVWSLDLFTLLAPDKKIPHQTKELINLILGNMEQNNGGFSLSKHLGKSPSPAEQEPGFTVTVEEFDNSGLHNLLERWGSVTLPWTDKPFDHEREVQFSAVAQTGYEIDHFKDKFK